MVKLAGRYDLAEQHILLEEIVMDLADFGLGFDAFEGLAGKRHLGLAQERRFIMNQSIQLGIPALVSHVQAETLLGVEPAEQIVMCRGLCCTSLRVREIECAALRFDDLVDDNHGLFFGCLSRGQQLWKIQRRSQSPYLVPQVPGSVSCAWERSCDVWGCGTLQLNQTYLTYHIGSMR
ncbi:hypothetical protein VTK56DRAFT_7908 [Thermocarpiscus australiensis]